MNIISQIRKINQFFQQFVFRIFLRFFKKITKTRKVSKIDLLNASTLSNLLFLIFYTVINPSKPVQNRDYGIKKNLHKCSKINTLIIVLGRILNNCVQSIKLRKPVYYSTFCFILQVFTSSKFRNVFYDVIHMIIIEFYLFSLSTQFLFFIIVNEHAILKTQ